MSCGVARGSCFKLHHYILSHRYNHSEAKRQVARGRVENAATYWMLRETIIGQRVGTRHLKYFATSEHDGPWERHSALSNAHIFTKAAARAIISRATAAVNVEPKLGPNHTNNNITLVTSLGVHLLYPRFSSCFWRCYYRHTLTLRDSYRVNTLAICCYTRNVRPIISKFGNFKWSGVREIFVYFRKNTLVVITVTGG